MYLDDRRRRHRLRDARPDRPDRPAAGRVVQQAAARRRGQPDSPFDPGGDPGRPFGAPLLVWTVEGDGAVLAIASTPDLPADLTSVDGPGDGHDRGHAGPDRRRPGRRRPRRRRAGDGLGQRRAADDRRRLAARRADPARSRCSSAPSPSAAGSRRRSRRPAAARSSSPPTRRTSCGRRCRSSRRTRASRWRRTATPRGTGPRSGASTASRSGCAGCSRTCSGSRASTRPGAQPRHEPVDLGILAAQAADRFAAVAETRHLDPGSVHAPDEPVVIAASAELVDRLIGVLVDNACKYAPEGGTVDVTVASRAAARRVTVDDSGPGHPRGRAPAHLRPLPPLGLDVDGGGRRGPGPRDRRRDRAGDRRTLGRRLGAGRWRPVLRELGAGVAGLRRGR